MRSFSITFDREDDVRKVSRRLVGKLGITGEIEMRPLPGGKWLLEVSSEKDVRDTTLEKLCGARVGADSLKAREAGT